MFSKAVWYLNKHTYHICITQHGYNQVLCLSLFIFQFCVYTHVCVYAYACGSLKITSVTPQKHPPWFLYLAFD